MKKCTKCGKNKPLVEFRFRNKKQNVLQTQCKQCCKIDGKNHYQSNKKCYVARALKRNRMIYEQYQVFKSTLKCEFCGEDFVACLEFHHVDPNSKENDLASMITDHGWKRFTEELNKCICVCANCHRKIHAGVLSIPEQFLQNRHSLMEKALVFETS